MADNNAPDKNRKVPVVFKRKHKKISEQAKSEMPIHRQNNPGTAIPAKPRKKLSLEVDAFVKKKKPLKRLTVDLPPELFKRLKIRCAQKDVKMSELVSQALLQTLS